jgi:hypothetical protein
MLSAGRAFRLEKSRALVKFDRVGVHDHDSVRSRFSLLSFFLLPFRVSSRASLELELVACDIRLSSCGGNALAAFASSWPTASHNQAFCSESCPKHHRPQTT